MKELSEKEFNKIDFENFKITKDLKDFILFKEGKYFLCSFKEFENFKTTFGAPYFNTLGTGNKCKSVIKNLMTKNINGVFLYPQVPQFINNKFEIFGIDGYKEKERGV